MLEAVSESGKEGSWRLPEAAEALGVGGKRGGVSIRQAGKRENGEHQ